ncbi:carboxylesterase/lipase family protein [Tsukamurella soli]|uniref:Carboxylic ester hydrolase n=1 Tax=Tsukamurella soli TaxID=644556 RepID=A0ABP8JS30_9ACTN
MTTEPGPIVTTAEGPVQGIITGSTHSWRGIPFAAPPVGALRWRAPQPVIPWTRVLAADSFRNAAPQPTSYTKVSLRENQPISEDCLTLNVVAPRRPGGPRPVMVFIHGGAYMIGSSATPLYHGFSLVERGDVVFVSVNYRLGALGYLDLSGFSTPERVFDSNLGLRDQVAALEWVQRNIAAFGGDPNCVTVFGESAGGNAVTTLLATPAAAGLFHRAIAESSAPGMTVAQERSREWAQQYVDLLRAAKTETDPAAAALPLIDLLDGATPAELGRTANRLVTDAEREDASAVPFGPTVDGDFLPHDPATALAAGEGHAVPLIIGTNASEATLFTRVPGSHPPSERGVARMLSEADPAVAQRITGAYRDIPGAKGRVRILGDHLFWAPSVHIAEAHSDRAPTYMYRYDFAPAPLRLTGMGATHATELLAVFGVYRGWLGQAIAALVDRKPALEITDRMQADWIAFARTGSPVSQWPRYDTARRATLVIDRRTHVEYDPDAAHRRAWEGFFPTPVPEH